MLVAVLGGFGLSFVGVGVLWIGTPWHYQALMFFPFLVLALAITWTGEGADQASLLILCGALPLAALLTLFRDGEGSHLMPILMVCAWLAGTLTGHYLARLACRKHETKEELR